MEAVLFYMLSAALIGFSILTVTARNPVRSAVFLISALLAIAGLFFLQKAEFVGAVQILVYVGGIMVLFIFVILLVSVRDAERGRRSSRQWKTGLALGVVLALQLGMLAAYGAGIFEPVNSIEQVAAPNTEVVGALLYSKYVLPFEIASVLLLVAIVGAVVMAKKEL
jgi:NADH-quinone oxidoreductase subunit J